MNTIRATDILCFSCGRKHTLVSVLGTAWVDCPTVFAHDIVILRTDCSDYLPKDDGNDCTGNCKQCTLTTEWQEWA